MHQNSKNAILVKDRLTCGNPNSYKTNHSCVAM